MTDDLYDEPALRGHLPSPPPGGTHPPPTDHGAGALAQEPAHGGAVEGDPFQSVGDEPALAGVAAASAATFHDHVLAMRARTTASQRRIAWMVAAAVGGPFAIVGAFLAPSLGAAGIGLLGPVLVAPLVEEMLKISGALYLAERRPWLVWESFTLPFIALAAGLFFAVVENVLYLNVYFPDPDIALIRWRWVAGPLLHGGASFIAGIGVAKIWERVQAGDGHAVLRPGLPWIVGAMVVHGLYNLTVSVLEIAGVLFPDV